MPLDEEQILEQCLAVARQNLPAAAEQMSEAVARAYVAEGHVKSWEMVKSIRWVVDPESLTIKIVVGAFYSAFLEFGSKHQRARHPVARAMIANLPQTIAILQGGSG